MLESKMGVKEACEKHLLSADLIARDGKTFCNFFVQRVANDLGCRELDNRTANQIYDYVSAATFWIKISAKMALDKAKEGFLVIACCKGDPHGHAAVVYPSMLVFSGKWGAYVPQVANVGKKNGVMGANFAFEDPPHYFLWQPTYLEG